MLAAVEYPALIEYRAFRNTDPPQLAEIWRSQAAQRGLMQPMSMAVFERFVLSKPVFERRGLVVAVEDGKALGFVHAGFGPSADGSTLSTARGVTCLLMLRPDADPSLAGPLLAASESYLRDAGAVELYGGGCYPLSPFYYGLYGGSELSGVLDSDVRLQAIFADHGYRAAKRSLVLHRELAGFRPVIDRQQMQIRRQTGVEMLVDAPTTNWWEACTFEPFDRTRCVLNARDGGIPASVNFWNMETMAGAWGLHAVGVAGLEITQTRRRQGLATYLLGEAFRHLHAQGVALVEVHVAEDNAAARALFANLGFTQVDASTLYRKE